MGFFSEVVRGTVAGNVGVSLETMLLIIFLVGGFVFYAKSFLVGISMHFVLSAGLFMLLYQLDMNWVPALVVCMMSVVVMALTLYSSSKQSELGGLV